MSLSCASPHFCVCRSCPWAHTSSTHQQFSELYFYSGPPSHLESSKVLSGCGRAADWEAPSVCAQGKKPHKSPNITCRLTGRSVDTREGKEEEQEKQMCNYVLSLLETDVSESEGHLRRGSPGSLLALWLLYSELALALTPAQPGITVGAVSFCLYTSPVMKDKIKDRLN